MKPLLPTDPPAVGEYTLLGRLGALAGDLQRHVGFEGDRDGAVRALVGAHAAEEEEVVARVRLAGVDGEVERVRAIREPRQVGMRPPLVQRERDQMEVRHELREPLVHPPRVSVHRAVDGMDGRRVDQPRQCDPGRAGVVVDDVELVHAGVAGERVIELPERAPDPLARRLLVDVRELRLRARVAGREERYVVAGVDEPVRQEGDDQLDPAVARGGHREPDRAEDRDLELVPVHDGIT
jgi:hypothetical protein